MDIWVTQAINNLAGQNAAIDRFMVLVTSYGVYALIIFVALFWWSPMQRAQMRHACLVAGISFLLSLAFNQLLLVFIHRIRPYDAGVSHLLIAPNPDWSFPSDHATAAAAIVSGLWFKGLRASAAVLAIMAVIICVSRIYVGVHYASDIVGGAMIGAVMAFLVARIYDDQALYARMMVRIL